MEGKVKSKGVPIGVRRIIAYAVLILISILCLFWFKKKKWM